MIAQMKDSSNWQKHLEMLKKELKVQEERWDHREEERIEIERRREEIRELEEAVERERSIERRRKLQIVHEDQMASQVPEMMA